jgi:RHS repeat-associated protein
VYEGVVKNNYLYNGKELLDEDADLGWLDYGFRNYDPQIGRFPQLDPLSWEYPYYTPYQFAGNDPIANVDLDGLEPWNVVSKIKSVLKEGGEHVVSGVRKSGLNIGKWTVSWFKDGVAFSHVFHSTGFLTQRFVSATIHLLSSASNIATSVPFKMRGDLANSFKIPNQQQQAINAYNAASSLLNEAIDKGWRRAETVNPDDPVLSGWQSWEVNDITGDKRINGLVQAITPVYPEAAIPFPKLGKLFSWLRSIKFGVGAAKGGVEITKHAAERMVERGITQMMVEAGIPKGTKYLDPKNGTFNYVLKNGFASGKDLLIGVSTQPGKVTTVLRGNNLVNKRFIPQYEYGNFRKNIKRQVR